MECTPHVFQICPEKNAPHDIQVSLHVPIYICIKEGERNFIYERKKDGWMRFIESFASWEKKRKWGTRNFCIKLKILLIFFIFHKKFISIFCRTGNIYIYIHYSIFIFYIPFDDQIYIYIHILSSQEKPVVLYRKLLQLLFSNVRLFPANHDIHTFYLYICLWKIVVIFYLSFLETL